jgi:hypothetical protein
LEAKEKLLSLESIFLPGAVYALYYYSRDTLETMPDDHTLFKQPQQDEFKTLVQAIIQQIKRETINSADEIT